MTTGRVAIDDRVHVVTFRNPLTRATLTVIGREAVARIVRDFPTVWVRESG